MRGLAEAVVIASLVSGCGSSPPAPPPAPEPTPSPTSGTPLEALFPLVDRHQYHYETEGEEGSGMLLARVRRDRSEGGSLQMSGGTKRFSYAPDGVVLEREGMMPVYVLKQPLQIGNRWRGEHGGWVAITEVDAQVQVPAGSYRGCVKTVEERGGDQPLRVSTTFCPEVGIVELEAASGAQYEKAVLTSYGPPVDLGPDGIKRIP